MGCDRRSGARQFRAGLARPERTRFRAESRRSSWQILLSDGLTRALQDGGISDIAQRITLHFGDACALMPELTLQAGRPDVVYLDPMYPERQKSAAVKKEMAYFHGLVGAAQDEAALLAAARTVARKRIVVKRPRLGVFLNGEEPAYQYAGKSTRFDVYLPFSPVTEK